jgi:hypothetical protein
MDFNNSASFVEATDLSDIAATNYNSQVITKSRIYVYDTGCGSDLVLKTNLELHRNLELQSRYLVQLPVDVEVFRVLRKDFLTGLPQIPEGSILIAEDAHFVNQLKKSVAQIFTYEQLLQIQQALDKRKIELRLIAHHKTATSRNRYSNRIDEITQLAQFAEFTKEKSQSKLSSKANDGDNSPEKVLRVLNADTKNSIRDILAIMFNIFVDENRFHSLKKFKPHSPESFVERERQRTIAARKQLSDEANMVRPEYDWQEHAAVAFANYYAADIIALLTEDERVAMGGVDKYAKGPDAGKEKPASKAGVRPFKAKVVSAGKAIDAPQARRIEPQSTMFALLAPLIAVDGSLRTRSVELSTLTSLPDRDINGIRVLAEAYESAETPEDREDLLATLNGLGVYQDADDITLWTVEVIPFWKYNKNTFYAMTAFHQKGGVVAAVIKLARQRLSPIQVPKFQNPDDETDPRNDCRVYTDEIEADVKQARSQFDKHLHSIHSKLREFVFSKAADTGNVLPAEIQSRLNI